MSRRNYCPNPSFEMDSGGGTAGMAAGWTDGRGASVAFPYSLVAGITGIGTLAQRFLYTGDAGDAAGVGINLYFITAVGSFVNGEPITFSFTVKGSISGCNCAPYVQMRNAAGSGLGGSQSVVVTPSGTATRYSKTFTANDAACSRFLCGLLVNNIHEGDTVDTIFDDVLAEKSAGLGDYFDGFYSNCAWTGPANASESVTEVGRLVPVIGSPIVQGMRV